ncbi:MAG: hypothetical protein ACMXX5_01820 [Candidatus Woesearchaeota archaeon]
MIGKNKIQDYLKKIIVIYKYESCAGCAQVCNTLDSLNLKYKKILRDKAAPQDFKNKSFVIIVAGDGTTLRTCQKIKNECLILTVNSSPLTTEGFLTRAKIDNFHKKFSNIIKGNFKIEKIPKLKVKVNNKILPKRAINEVLISTKSPYHTFIYDLNENIEKSTGILVSTPIGSTGWAKSAGGKVMKPNSKKMQFVIREPYNGRIYKVKKKYGIVDSFKVKAISPGIIVFDSVENEFHFKKEDIIEVIYSKETLNFINPK